MLKRIAITGPESTGKSSLAKSLAEHYQADYVPEFARDYLQTFGIKYKEDDLLKIAKGQILIEDKFAEKAESLLFCDSDLTVIEIWSMDKYGRVDDEILELLHDQTYDLVLLCDIDLEWEDDPMRENPKDRDRLLRLYKESLQKRSINYYMLSGKGKKRTQNAINIIDSLIIE